MMEKYKARLVASRARATAAIMETIMATHHWIPSSWGGGHYDSDEDYGYAGSDISDLDWLPALF
jgi:hypothetical protein